MNNIAKYLNENDLLARLIHRYELGRQDGRIFIDVFEWIFPVSVKYLAVPNLLLGDAEDKFFGRGDSPESALIDCLSKIKDVPIEVIIPKLSDDES
jgi:hypothetical protein